jgi:hypothetical protein
MAYLFKGSGTVCGISFPKKLRKVDFDDPESDVDTTGGGDTEKTYEAGLADQKLTIEVLGGESLSKGMSGATNITWGDGTNTNWTNSTITSKKKSGQVGNVIVHTVTLRKVST